jgi:hypothetical protein
MEPRRTPGETSLAGMSSGGHREEPSTVHPGAQEPDSSSNEPMRRTPIDSDHPPGDRSSDMDAPVLPREVEPAFPRWLARMFIVIEVIVWVELGIILVIAPWTRYWSGNSLILSYPHLRELLGINFIRGTVTGIGLLDIWTGIWRLLRYRDPVREPAA